MTPTAANTALTLAGRPARILIVDDQPVNLEMVGAALGKLACEIVIAKDGPTALKRVELRPVDLILLDVNMPGMDGCEVCRRLGAAGLGNVPVIFLSGAEEKDMVVRALDAGGVDYITKPFNHAELIARVRTQLDLKSARDRLQQLAKDKDELIGILAHDMKSHLAGVQLSAQLLQERIQHAEKPDPRAGQLAENIAHTSGQLLAFVKGFLANAAADHHLAIQLQPANLAVAAGAVVAQLQESARRKQIDLQFQNRSTDPVVLADEPALGQVFENLLTNAVKFSPLNQPVLAQITDHGSHVEFRVQDQGPGFTEADKEKMFRRYARLSARPTAGEPSSGLGLSIARKLVLAMNGELSCESSAGQGATFTVRLPRATTSQT